MTTMTVTIRVSRQPFNTRPTIEIEVVGGTADENQAAIRVAAEVAETLVKASA